MSSTFTYSQTKTFKRLDLLKTQVRIALRRTTNISQQALKRLEEGIENHWIKRFHVYALEQSNLCRAELILEINWNEHEAQIAVGRVTVTVDERWVDNTSIEVEEVVNLFNSFVSTYGLTTHWRVQFSDWVNAEQSMYQHVLSQLGLKNADPIEWAGQRRGSLYQVPEIPEFSVGCYVVCE